MPDAIVYIYTSDIGGAGHGTSQGSGATEGAGKNQLCTLQVNGHELSEFQKDDQQSN